MEYTHEFKHKGFNYKVNVSENEKRIPGDNKKTKITIHKDGFHYTTLFVKNEVSESGAKEIFADVEKQIDKL